MTERTNGSYYTYVLYQTIITILYRKSGEAVEALTSNHYNVLSLHIIGFSTLQNLYSPY